MSPLPAFSLLRFLNYKSDKQSRSSSYRTAQVPAQLNKSCRSGKPRYLTREVGRTLHIPLEEHPPSSTAKLQLLPAELYLHLTSFLPFSSIIALSHTCPQFLHWSPVVIEHLFDRFHSASETPSRLDDQERYKRIIRTGRQWKINRRRLLPRALQHRLFCHSCHTDHEASEFSITALRDPLPECIRSEGRLWVCPSVSWTFDQTVAVNRNARHVHDNEYHHCDCLHHFTHLHIDTTTTMVLAYLLARYIRPGNVTNTATLKYIRTALKSTHLRICPHLSISDPRVRARFMPECKRTFEMTANQCGCRLCSGRLFRNDEVACTECLTNVQFRRKMANGMTYLYLLTLKSIDERFLSRNNGEMWRRIVTLPSEMERLNDEWDPFNFRSVDTVTVEENPFDGGCFVL